MVACFILGTGYADELRAESEIFFDVSGTIRFESRSFRKPGLYQGQERNASGFVFEPEFYIENSRGWSFNFSPFLRYDNSDSERNHADIREAYLLMFGDLEDNEWELRLGIDHVFWGVAETTNLVDIINQYDAVEDPFGKVKLGQMMAHLTISGDWGAGEFFYLPEHRARPSPGRAGRLRSALIVNNRLAKYESDDRANHDDYAFRFSKSIGTADIGISVFDGTSREPSFRPDLTKNPPLPVPNYDQIRQYGFDMSMGLGDFLFKGEAMHRAGGSNLIGKKDDYSAYILGGEYSFYSVFESNYDVLLLGEWLYDERGALSTSPFQDDIFLAARLAFNDVEGTELTASVIKDRDYETKTFSIEFRRRINDEWSLTIEAIDFAETDPKDMVQYPTRQDSFVDLSLAYSF